MEHGKLPDFGHFDHTMKLHKNEFQALERFQNHYHTPITKEAFKLSNKKSISQIVDCSADKQVPEMSNVRLRPSPFTQATDLPYKNYDSASFVCIEVNVM